MISADAQVQPRMDRVQRSADRATFQNLHHAAFAISRDAKASIEKSGEPSEPGSPPTTRGKGGKNLRGAIFTDANMESAIIGPRASFVGDVGEAHEFGEDRKGDSFPERRFMQPALERNLDRFAYGMRGSIGE